jgi:hypothetical protein
LRLAINKHLIDFVDGRNPLGDNCSTADQDVLVYAALSIQTKLFILYALCNWVLEESSAVASYLESNPSAVVCVWQAIAHSLLRGVVTLVALACHSIWNRQKQQRLLVIAYVLQLLMPRRLSRRSTDIA